MKKRTEIDIEIEETVVISGGSGLPRLPCPVCAESLMITPDEAATLARVSVRSIYAWVEAGGVHFLETPDGLFLCINSFGGMEQTFSAPEKLICATDTDATPPDKG